MAVPGYQEFMLPILKIFSDEKIYSKREIADIVSERMHLSEEDKSELLPSGAYTRYYHRIGWATFDMYKAGLLERPQQGRYRITKRGLGLLKEEPNKINVNLLISKYEDFRNSRHNLINSSKVGNQQNILENIDDTKITPEEEIDHVNRKLKQALSDELLDVVKSVRPAFFEQLVIDLLLKMGYGGSKAEAGKAVGKSGDGGIDGIINEDRLGLDKVYVQAKRWEATVGRPQIQAFVGSLAGHHSKKGIFITTSEFTKEAREYVEKVDSQISLIDGSKLVDLMIEHNLGVNIAQTYEIKKIDRDYFPEDI